MISKSAIEEFHNRKLDDWSWLKEVPESDIQELLKDIAPDFSFKTKPYAHQLPCFVMGIKNNSFLFYLDPGTGKAQPLDSRIVTPTGYKLMGNLQINDYVCTPDGGKAKILNIYPQGVKDVYRVTFNDGSSTECCEEHLWKVYRPSLSKTVWEKNSKKHYRERIIPLSEIKKAVRYKDGSAMYSIPMTSPVAFQTVDNTFPLFISLSGIAKVFNTTYDKVATWEKKGYIKSDIEIKNSKYYTIEKLIKDIKNNMGRLLNFPPMWEKNFGVYKFKIDSYVLGALLGDGGLSNGSTINFTNIDEELIEEVKKGMPPYCSLVKGESITWGIRSTNRHYYNPMLYALRKLNLMGKKSEAKFIPDCYKIASKKDRLSLLQGLLDTDGYIDTKGSVSFSSSSKQLIEDVKFLVQSLGGVVRCCEKETTHLLHYILYIRLPKGVRPFRLSRKLNRILPKQKYFANRRITSVEYIGKKETQCIMLDSIEGLYLTDDFIVTHNTKLIQDILTHLKQQNNLKSALILSPNISTVTTWADQTNLHSDLSYIELIGTAEERWKLMETKADLFFLNYTGLQVMTTETQKNPKTKKNEWVPIPQLIKKFQDKFNVVIYDESHYLKSRQSLNYEICNELSKTCEYRYGLSGTPFGRSPEDLWTQFHLIDRGETLGEYITLFRQAFFDVKVNRWGGYEHTFIKKYEKDLNKRLQNKSIRYAEEECNSLPDKIYKKISIPFTKEQYEYYKHAVSGIIEAKGNITEIKNAFVRLRQITSGFLKYKDDSGEGIEIVFTENPKLDALCDFIQNLPEDEKVIVFNEYIKSGDLISERFKKLKIKHSRLYGGTKDKKEVKETFLTDKDCKVFLANVVSAGTGIDGLQDVARYIVYFESPVSSIVRRQSEKRLHRSGQKRRTFIVDITLRNSIDERVLAYLKEGKDLFDALLADPKLILE